MNKLIRFRIELQGIYGWGEGFYNSELSEAWHETLSYLEEYGADFLNYWHVIHDDTSHYGVSTYGHMFIHPMDLTGTIEQQGRNSVKGKVNEVVSLAKHLLTACGLSGEGVRVHLWETPLEGEREVSLEAL